MATNQVQEGKVLDLTIASVTANDPVMFGTIAGNAQTDTDSAGKVRVQTEGVFTYAVGGEDGSGAAAIAKGGKVYYDAAATPKINGDSANGVLFGKVLDAVTSGSSTNHSVMLIQA
jgi:predicted RecA/RadA family phage recombinase